MWNPCFSRSFNNWEMDCVERCLTCLHGKRNCRDEGDKLLWTESKIGKIIVKSHYNSLKLYSSVSFPMRSIWNLWV